MNIKHLFFCMLLIAFSSCSKPGYEKAIAEWVQTDSHGTWTDLKFELLEVLETEDVTVSDSLRYLNNKSAQLSAVIQKAESPRALFKPSFSAYMEAEKSLKATDAMKAMYLHRDSTEVIGKILNVIVKTCSDIFYTIGQKKCPMPSAKIRNYSHSHNLVSQ